MLRSNYIIAVTLVISTFVLSSCYFGYNDKSKRNVEFAPNMYKSIPLEPFSQTVDEEGSAAEPVFANGHSSQMAPEGTVPRSDVSWYREEAYVPFHYENTVEEYELAGQEVTSPLYNEASNDPGYNCTEETFLKGKRIYGVYCIMCHGENGDGKGNLVTSGKFGAVPPYNDEVHRDLPAGKLFFSITHGKGIMGSYASQLTPQQRWEVICYIQKFQEKE